MSDYLNHPWRVGLSDFKFKAHGEQWCVYLAYEEMDGGYTPMLAINDGGVWSNVSTIPTLHFRDAQHIRDQWGGPLGYLNALCAAVNARIAQETTVPEPTPGDALSRTLFHAMRSLRADDGGNLSVHAPTGGLVP